MSSAAPQRLAGKRCLITGGSRGLGRAITREFVRSGARVAFTYLRDEAAATAALAELTDLTPADVSRDTAPFVLRGDVCDGAHARDAVTAVVARWGGIDVLVNNAGTTQILPIGLLDEEDWDRVIDVNLRGAYLFTRSALRPMIRARAGAVLNIGSFASERIIEAPAHYAAAKSGLRGFTEAMAREVGRYNIRVNLLAPGLLDVGLAQTLPRHRIAEYLSQCALGRLGTAAEVAATATFMVSDACSFMTGAKLVADGGL